MSEQNYNSSNDGKPMLPAVLSVQATWTNDCQGKKDYDGQILSISTRYWPARDYRSIGGNLTKPSAKSSIVLRYGEDDYYSIVEKEFEADTEEQVKAQVEEWAQSQMDILVDLLKNAFQLGQHSR